MNSVSEALYFGVPLAMLPKTKEQEGVAERVRQLGAGMVLKDASVKSIAAAVSALLTDSAYRQNAAEIAAGFRKCGGAAAAADKIERCCRF